MWTHRVAMDSGLQLQVTGNLVHLILINITTGTPQPPKKGGRHEWEASSFHRRTMVETTQTAHILSPVRPCKEPTSISLLLF